MSEELKEEITQGIADPEEVRELEKFHPSELARHLGEESPEAVYKMLTLLGDEYAANVLVETEDDVATAILKHASRERLLAWTSELPSDDAAYLIGLLRESLREEVLWSMKEEDREEVDEILRYKEDDVGSIMQHEALSVPASATVEEAISKIRRDVYSEPDDEYHKAYVVNDEGKLVGEVPLVTLLLSAAETKVADIAEKPNVVSRPDMPKEELANLAVQYDEVSIPVVDHEGKLVGRVTFDDLGEVLQEEFEEDIGIMAGTGEERAGDVSTFRAVEERLPWLSIALLGGLATAWVMGYFEGELASHPILVFFVPLIAGMGGNAGIQSSSIVVRGLATGEIHPGEIFPRLIRELKIAFINASACAFLIVLFTGFILGQFVIGIFVALCMILVMVFAAGSGSVVPIVLKSFKVDPAYSTGPFITIGNDIVGIAIYLWVMQALIRFQG